MFHPQQPLFSHYSHQTLTNPNSNPYLPFPQQIVASDVPALRPPGTEPGLYPLTHIGFEAQSLYFVDPNAGSLSWLVGQVCNTKKSKVVQSMQCEVCKIEFNSKDVFEKHVLGKKHQKNLQIKNDLTSATFPTTYNTTNNISLPGPTIGASGVAGGYELEIKRQKVLISGASSDSVRVCTICNVACNSQEVW